MSRYGAPGRRLLIAALAAGVTAVGAVTATLAQASPTPALEAVPSGFLAVADAVPDSYLVMLKGRPSLQAQARTDVGNEARALAAKHGGKHGAVFSAALRGLRLQRH